MARASEGEIIVVPVERVKPFEDQPRTFFEQNRLYRLSLSIKKLGQKHPVLLTPLDGAADFDYEIVDGERRWRACKMAGIGTVRGIVVRIANKGEQFELSAISNFVREPHTPLETANALQRIRTERNASYDDLAEMFAKSTAWVANHLSLLRLDPRVQALMDPNLPEEKRLNITLAMLIAKIENRTSQATVASHIVSNGLRLTQAKIYIEKQSASRGVQILRKRKAKPSEDHRAFRRFTERLALDAETIGKLKQRDFGKFMDRSSIGELREMTARLQETSANLAAMAASLGDVLKRKEEFDASFKKTLRVG